MRRLVVCGVTAVALVLAGCGQESQERAAEKAIEKSTGGKVKADLSEGKVAVKTDDAETVITPEGGGRVPEGFPADVPLYKGASVVAATKLKTGFFVILQSSDDAKRVADTCKAEMKAKGWEEETAVNVPQGTVVSYKKAGHTVVATIAAADGKTQIQLAIEMKDDSPAAEDEKK